MTLGWPHRAALGIVAVVAVVAAAFHGYSYRPLPAAVVGESLLPVPVYAQHFVVTPGPNEQSVPYRDHPKSSAVLSAQPVTTLHVTYARVESMPYDMGWLVHLVAPDAEPALLNESGSRNLAAVIDGQAVSVWPKGAFPDRDADCFLMLRSSGGPDAALALARSLTTEVSLITEDRW